MTSSVRQPQFNLPRTFTRERRGDLARRYRPALHPVAAAPVVTPLAAILAKRRPTPHPPIHRSPQQRRYRLHPALYLPEVITPHRIYAGSLCFNGRPFAGEGHSLYVTAGDRVRYNDLRILGGKIVKGGGSTFDIAAVSVPKTARVAYAASPATTIEYSLPEELAEQEISIDVRHYKDDIECEVEHFRTRSVTLDADLAAVNEIKGTATTLEIEQRSGGTVRLRFLYAPSRDGVQPYLFRAMRTAGPSSPAAVTVRYSSGQRVYEIDVPSLLDASPYTYTIRAENQAGSVTANLITGWIVTADASGPPLPLGVVARAW